jgi:hypothetical protein
VLRAIAILLLATGPALAEPARRCDATKLQADGEVLFARGETAAAYVKFDAAAKCKPSDRVHELAAFSACKLYQASRSEHWVARAKYFFAKLPAAKRANVERACQVGCGGPDGGSTDR